ncbi:cysteine-rich secretory protein family domain-containing protein [Hirsutella rhossiliensis]|uniref:Cysteine-rich secretory protein family domain-containing protein n=1 Tax=Hirsutella rhossiliensis TaxID=111463 RepID=A0A9P8N633_9HYPO|nr:cysteine-rich secretory protein family domain-containing protein [Hirsutella rhossiliensis]KAH0966464.1 cysteine-rich secretory protein family domain-containing protein [Hirsutella rhossiliensis]
MHFTTLLSLALPIIAAFPLDEAASSHIDKRQEKPTKDKSAWTQWDEDAAAMSGDKWASPKGHKDGSAWAKEGWPESAKSNRDWTLWDEDEDARTGRKWNKGANKGANKGGPKTPPPQSSPPQVPPPQSVEIGNRFLGDDGNDHDGQNVDDAASPPPDNTVDGPFDESVEPPRSFNDDLIPQASETPLAPKSPQSSGTPGETGSSGPGPPAEVKAALAKTNELRAKHGSAEIYWDEKLASNALRWAQECASGEQMKHSLLPNETENLWSGSGIEGDLFLDAIESWYSEEPIYNTLKQVIWGHFTQLVWNGSTQMGCASADGTRINPKTQKITTFIVCRFSPPGNEKKSYAENVKAPAS